MKALLTALALATTGVATTAVANADFKYGWLTGALPGTELVAANVVREPAFVGEKDEQVQAMDQATNALNSDYCSKKGSEFIADPKIIIFDKGLGEWMIGGVCR
jgi:hypothetical protein